MLSVRPASSESLSSDPEEDYGSIPPPVTPPPSYSAVPQTEDTEDTSNEDSQDSYGSSEYSGEEHLYESVDSPVAVGGNDIITIMEGEPTCPNDGHEWSKTFCLRCGVEYGRIPCSSPKVVGPVKTRPNLLAVANITTLMIRTGTKGPPKQTILGKYLLS